jgi:pyruvate,water dikinase
MQAFLFSYGHRAAAPAELAAPRWGEDPTAALRLLADPPAMPAPADEHAISVLLASIDARDAQARKAAQQSIDSLRTLVPLQSKAMEALAYYFAGARRWAWGASREAMSDNRLAAADDVFFFELEELKRMMTNEWNVSDSVEIQATAAKRKAAYASWQEVEAPALLLGDTPATTLDRLEPSPVLLPGLYLQGVRTRNGEGAPPA